MNAEHRRPYAAIRRADAKRLLWKQLKSRKHSGCRFRRHFPLGLYIVDFVCMEKRLVIDIVDDKDDAWIKRQGRRDEWLRARGFGILRFTSGRVLNETQLVVDTVRARLTRPT